MVLSDLQRDAIRAAIEAVDEVQAAWLFGSYARGEARASSDVDIAVLLGESPRPPHRVLGDLASRLDGVVSGHAVDIVILNHQGPIFGHQVLREGQLISCRDEEARIDYESDNHVRYLDFRPTWELAAARSAQGLKDWLNSRS